MLKSGLVDLINEATKELEDTGHMVSVDGGDLQIVADFEYEDEDSVCVNKFLVIDIFNVFNGKHIEYSEFLGCISRDFLKVDA